MARRRPRTRRPRSKLGLLSLLTLLAAFSLIQYLETGTVPAPGELRSAADTSSASRQSGAPASAVRGIATRITDGDTFTLNYSSTEDERVRLHGIDAPERDQPHGPAAGSELARLIEGREVRVEIVERDNYGRLVGRVWIDDLDINLTMVEGGHAWWYEYYAQERLDLELAENSAHRAQRGLWAQRNPVPPWEWRRNQR